MRWSDCLAFVVIASCSQWAVQSHADEVVEKPEFTSAELEVVEQISANGIKEVARLEKQIESRIPANVRATIEKIKQMRLLGYYLPEVSIGDLQVGMFCTLVGDARFGGTAHAYEVFQIIDESNFLIKARDVIVWVSGVKTSGFVDGRGAPLPYIMKVTKTRQYETAIGGSKTVFEIAPQVRDVDSFLERVSTARLRQLQKLAAKHKEDAEKAKQIATAEKTRTWKDVTGSFSLVAEFAGVVSGKVRLKKKDGSIISVPLDQLSEADQKWIKSR